MDTNFVEFAAPTAPNTSTVVERVDLREYKNDILALCQRNGTPEVARRFDWYYRDQGQERPFSWILRDGKGEICGLCSVTVRDLRHGKTTVKAGVAGNLLVDRSKRVYLGAFSLVRATKSLVTNKEVDILMGIPNQFSQPIFLRLGYKVIDLWTTHAFIHGSRQLLQSHLGWVGRVASPIVDFCAAAKRVLAANLHPNYGSLRVVNVPEAELGNLSLEDWSAPQERFVQRVSSEYLRWRFFRDPVNRYEILAIVPAAGRPCAYVVVRHNSERSWIVDCGIDSQRVTAAHAILQACHARSEMGSTVWVAHLRSLPLSSQLTSHGFVCMPPSLGGYPYFPLVGFWLGEHPLAHAFAQARAWNIFNGFNDV